MVYSAVFSISGMMVLMEFTPHSLNMILSRIREQMRCPQCGTHVSVDFPSVKIISDEFMLLQLRCQSCASFIVLHVSLRAEIQNMSASLGKYNASSSMSLTGEEMATLKSALDAAGGSFEKLFQK